MSDTKASEPTTTKEQTRTLAFPQVVNSSVTFLHQVAHFQVMFLNNSLFVWVGGADRTLDQLTSGVAWEKTEPAASILVSRGDSDDASESLTKRLVTRFGCPVHVSYSLDVADSMFRALLEKAITKAVAAHRDGLSSSLTTATQTTAAS